MKSTAEQVELLKQLQADCLVFFMKVHNFHWTVKGRDFPQVHKATEEIYTRFAGIFDDLAERVGQLGATPLVTLSQIMALAKVKEDSRTSFNSEEVLSALLADYDYFLASFRKLSEVASGVGDTTTQGYADSTVAELEKAIWMLRAQLS